MGDLSRSRREGKKQCELRSAIISISHEKEEERMWNTGTFQLDRLLGEILIDIFKDVRPVVISSVALRSKRGSGASSSESVSRSLGFHMNDTRL